MSPSPKFLKRSTIGLTRLSKKKKVLVQKMSEMEEAIVDIRLGEQDSESREYSGDNHSFYS